MKNEKILEEIKAIEYVSTIPQRSTMLSDVFIMPEKTYNSLSAKHRIVMQNCVCLSAHDEAFKLTIKKDMSISSMKGGLIGMMSTALGVPPEVFSQRDGDFFITDGETKMLLRMKYCESL